MNEEKNPRKQYAIYIVICLIVLMVFNFFIMPSITRMAIKDTDYSFFLDKIDDGTVTKVEIADSDINFIVEENGKEQMYTTPKIDDPELVSRLHEQKNIEFAGKIQQESPLRNFLLGWVIPIIFLGILWNLLFNNLGKRMGGLGNAMSFGKSNAKIYVKAQTGKTFADVAGQDEAKEALAEIVDFLHNPDKYAEIGADLPKGALLVGPPGTGKTLLAQAVAGEAEVPFFSISGSEFVEMFVGMGAAKVRDLFRQANEKAPCIVFIDEIDTIGKKRDGQVGGNDEREQTLNQLLTEMDGFDGKKGVVILGATNRPESLDPALLRPGRFDRRIPVELPDLAGREAVLRVHANKVKLAEGIDFNAVARATAGASGAELANIVNEAALRAVRSGRKAVTQSDLEESVAVHKITIIPRTSGALGYTMQIDEDEKFLLSKEEALSKIATLTGGRSAEELIFNTCTSGASNDIEKATQLARAMVTRYGMSSKFDMVALETVSNQYLGGDASLVCSPETAAQIDEEVNSIVKNAHAKAVQILSENIGKLHELAGYLLEKETITGEEFMDILQREAVPAV